MISAESFQAIADLDLEPIKVKLMHEESGEGWSLQKANAVEFEYRRFLYLMKTFPQEQTAPLMDVDTFWHYHILDTMKYAADCDAVFGYFLHHFPYIGLRGEDDEAAHHRVGERMKELYEATFGEDYLRADTAYSGAAVAYSGAAAKQAQTAYSGATAGQTAYSGAAVAYSGAAVQAKTAYSGATAGQTAYSGAAVQAKTAYSGAAVQAKTAYSGAAVQAKTAYSGAAVQAKTAYSGATAGQTAYSGAAVQAKTAYSGAATGKTAYSGAQVAYSGAAQQQQAAPSAMYTVRPRLTPEA